MRNSFLGALICAIGLALFLSSNLRAAEEANENSDDVDEINTCLSHWENSPFKKDETKFRTFGVNVNVFGIGGEVTDNKKTEVPELILVKPNVNVLGKSTLRLLNPQGWYCLRPTISVLAKTQIEMNCKAHVTSTSSGTNVLGAKDKEQGVVVLGSLRIRQIGCE